MKKHLLIGLSLIAVLLGCSTDEEISRSDFKALSFETFVGKGTTRAIAKTSFADGDDFGVFAYRHGTDSWSADVTKESFMDNVKVSRQSGTWTYSPTRYWDEGINHTFLAYSPYNAGYTMPLGDGLLWGITTAAKASDQVDLLYSVPDVGSKNLVWKESGTKVVIPFRHALSQVKLSASTDQDYSGYYTARVRQVRLVGIGDTGNLNLNAADAEVSPWSNQGSSLAEGVYAATTDALDIPLGTVETLLNPGNNLFMQIPQEVVNNGTAYFEITYDIEATEAGNVSNAGTGKTAIVGIPDITWEHNRIYHYKIQMDLQQLLNLRPIEVGEPDVVEWEAGTETKLPEDLTVTIESTTGDTPQTGTGNATLGITKSNEAGGTQTVQIENPEKDDQWIVEVGPEITDAATPATRAGKTPADWLRVCREGETATEATKLYGKEDASILIKITGKNTSTKQRKAEVTIKRALSGVTRIMVTQEKAPAAVIEANSTQFKMEGGTNQLTIVNEASASWTISKSDGADWLSLQDTDGNAVTGGTAGQTVKAVTQPNYSTSVRTATITLERAGQDPVLVEVTQAAPQPMTVSTKNFSFTYLNGSQSLTITNPEGEKDGFQWTLEGTAPDWLTVSPTTGTGKKGQVTFTAAQVNTAASARTSAKFTLKRRGQVDIPITVGQGGAPATTLSTSAINLDYSAHSGTFNISGPSGIQWVLLEPSSWLTITPTSGYGNAKITYQVAANASTTAARSTYITLARAGQSKSTILLSQGKAPVPEITVTPKIYYGTAKQTGGYIISYKVDAPAGVQWTAIVNTRYAPLHNYITFFTGGKTYTGTGPTGFAIYVKGYPYSSSGYTGAIDITPVGGKTIQAGVILNP